MPTVRQICITQAYDCTPEQLGGISFLPAVTATIQLAQHRDVGKKYDVCDHQSSISM